MSLDVPVRQAGGDIAAARNVMDPNTGMTLLFFKHLACLMPQRFQHNWSFVVGPTASCMTIDNYHKPWWQANLMQAEEVVGFKKFSADSEQFEL